MAYVPEWTEEEMITIRRLVKQGLSAKQIKEVFPTPLGEDGIIRRCRRFGMKVQSKKLAHEGTSSLYVSKHQNKDYTVANPDED